MKHHIPNTRKRILRTTGVTRGEWPDDFWRAFEGMPEGFERPVQVPQKRDVAFVTSSDPAIKPV